MKYEWHNCKNKDYNVLALHDKIIWCDTYVKSCIRNDGLKIAGWFIGGKQL